MMDKVVMECMATSVSVVQMRAETYETAITLTPHMVLPLFATRFAEYAGGIRVSFIQQRLF